MTMRFCRLSAHLPGDREEWSPEAKAEWRQGVIDDYGELADEVVLHPAQGSGAWLTAPLIEARWRWRDPVLSGTTRWSKFMPERHAPVIRSAARRHPPSTASRRNCSSRSSTLSSGHRALPRTLHAPPATIRAQAFPAVLTLLAIEKQLRQRSVLTVEMRNAVRRAEEDRAPCSGPGDRGCDRRHRHGHNLAGTSAASSACARTRKPPASLGGDAQRQMVQRASAAAEDRVRDDAIALAGTRSISATYAWSRSFAAFRKVPAEREGAAGAKATATSPSRSWRICVAHAVARIRLKP